MYCPVKLYGRKVHQKNEGGPFENIIQFSKKSFTVRKKLEGDALFSPGTVSYAKKMKKTPTV